MAVNPDQNTNLRFTVAERDKFGHGDLSRTLTPPPRIYPHGPKAVPSDRQHGRCNRPRQDQGQGAVHCGRIGSGMTTAPALSPRRDCPAKTVSGTLRTGEKEVKLAQDETWEVLLARANDGDGAAFGQFLRAVTPSLRRIIQRRGDALPPDQHEDILQDVLLAIHLKRHTWRRQEPVRPWLYALARYKVVDAFRRRGASVTLPIEDFIEVLPEDTASLPLAARDADVMLAQIDARSALLVRAVALDGKTTEEAGAMLGLTAGTARVALHRAMRRLTDVAERMLK